MSARKRKKNIAKTIFKLVFFGGAIYIVGKLVKIVIAGRKLDFYLNGISNVRLDNSKGLRVKFDVAIFLRNKENTSIKVDSMVVRFNIKDKPTFAQLTGSNIEAKANDITRVVLTAQTADLVNLGIQVATTLIEMLSGNGLDSLFYNGSMKAYGTVLNFGQQELKL